jgi:transcriptional regulator with XRE-family HTH domain
MTYAADIALMARARAGLTQAELAARSGFSRETIARWEGGSREPTLTSLNELVAAAGLELVVGLAAGDESLDELVAHQLALSPAERLAALLPPEQLRKTLDAISWLERSTNSYIAIGSVTAALQGGPQRPGEGSVDVVAADPDAFAQELRESGLTPVDSAERWAQEDRRWPWLLSSGGSIVLASRLPGSGDFKDLRRNSHALRVDGGNPLVLAHPRDLLRLAEASPRPEERSRIPGLRALLRATTAAQRDS